MAESNGFSGEQKNFLQGFAMGADVARAVRGLPIVSGSGGSLATVAPAAGLLAKAGPKAGAPEPSPRPEHWQFIAQDAFVASGKTLCKEELAKRAKDPLCLWDEMVANAEKGVFPKNTDVLLYKYSGLFYVAPNQDAFMTRLRFPGGVLPTWQFRGVADLARRFGGGYSDVTTRANLQIREIGASDAVNVLMGLAELGIVNRGAGADNIRNITANATSGIDPQEWAETLPLAREMHHYILNHREMYGLPRKFNIAFEGGGRVASLDDTNDIGLRVVQVPDSSAGPDLPAGVYFQLTLGGITGHKDFARGTGVLATPEECVPLAAAVVRVFLKNGNRGDRKNARLKYVLDDWGFDKFLAETEVELGRPLRKVAQDRYENPPADDRWAHVGVHPQKQEGRFYLGVVLPVGRMTVEQMDGLADLADRHGSRSFRLTVWQNLLIPDIAGENLDAVKAGVEALGLEWDASSYRAGLVACTGNAGCKFAASNTKRHAMILARFLEERVPLDRPINLHVTGCNNSCAQHYIGDIGLEGTKVEVGEEMVEGYHVHVGGGYGPEQVTGRRLFERLAFEEIPPILERLLNHYLEGRRGPEESFTAFASRHSLEELKAAAAHHDLAMA